MQRYVVIMAGGIGSRFWPSSKTSRPKQFLDILGVGKSLIRMTFERIQEMVPIDNILILTHSDYRDLVSEHLPELNPKNILCEPVRNNTAPCIAYAMLNIEARNEGQVASFAVLPSDHVILDEAGFQNKLSQAFDEVERNETIVTLGIKPTRPDTGYGYIKFMNDTSEIKKVESFKEKPNYEVASEYVKSGEYLWNAGMFIWTTNSLRQAFQLYAPAVLTPLEQKKEMFNTPNEDDYLNEVYHLTPSISIDYAIMEDAKNVHTIISDIGWSDLGTWDGLYCHCEKDDNQNLIFDSNVVLHDVKSSIIKTNPNKNTVIRGLENFIIVDEDDALLIFPKNEEQDIKNAIKKFEK